ncbi:hypothetical protein Btru_059381 [Bulinus truncatus]|nr:hypothetical protein Btru_059381 [Bulinus truncatus]
MNYVYRKSRESIANLCTSFLDSRTAHDSKFTEMTIRIAWGLSVQTPLSDCVQIEKISAECSPGWFGSECQYLCHCNFSGRCDFKGSCSTKCANGRFGTKCQYQNLALISGITLVTTPPMTIKWLKDDASCNVDPDLKSVTLIWNTLLIVTGSGVKSLCSLYTSGGRNVALKQSTFQSTSLLPVADGHVAVDGKTGNHYYKSGCTHTTFFDDNPSWTVTFDSAKSVQRLILYNRDDCCSDRLKNFKIQAFDSNNKSLWTYTDSRDTQKTFLTLCEVELYGDCAPGMWGLECIEMCPQSCPSWCHQNTGQCPSCLGFSDPPVCRNVCPRGQWGSNCERCSGYTNPPDCNIECPKGRWDVDCENNCGENCYNRSCDRVSGVCDEGCDGYINPPFCTEECFFDHWGHNCEYDCGKHCYNESCHAMTGVCDKGCNGFSNPPECNIECTKGLYGPNCTYKCSTYCKDAACYGGEGYCFSCQSGYAGDFCDQIIKDWTTETVMEVVIGACVGIVVCIIGLFIMCRAKVKKL